MKAKKTAIKVIAMFSTLAASSGAVTAFTTGIVRVIAAILMATTATATLIVFSLLISALGAGRSGKPTGLDFEDLTIRKVVVKIGLADTIAGAIVCLAATFIFAGLALGVNSGLRMLVLAVGICSSLFMTFRSLSRSSKKPEIKMDIEIIKMRVKHRSRVALPFLGFEAVFYVIARIAGLRQAADLTWLVGCVFCLPYFTFRYYQESMKVKK